jgi:hypothetical protein
MRYDKSFFNKIQEKEGGMSVELGDDVAYPMRGIWIYFFLDAFG